MEAALQLERQYPEIAYKQVNGILQLTRQYSAEKVDQACGRAKGHGKASYHIIENILRKGLQQERYMEDVTTCIHDHSIIRGAFNYQ